MTFQAVHAAVPADRLTQHLGRAGLRPHSALSQHFSKLWGVRAVVGDNLKWRFEACPVWLGGPRKGKVSHMDLLREANPLEKGGGEAESAEERVIRWARSGGEARPRGALWEGR